VCLLVLAWRLHPRYPLIVAANRDELHERPAAPLALWPEGDILGGRDLLAGGAWLAVDRQRRFGVVTNFRETQRRRRSAPSRGGLIPAYLRQQRAPMEYLTTLEVDAPGYSGFNLLLADSSSLCYASNRADRFARPLEPGVYGLSNEFLDAPWAKLKRVRKIFTELVGQADLSVPALFAMLADRVPAEPGEDPPYSGARPEWERPLSAPFVLHPEYGTRCSTVMLLAADGELRLAERRFAPDGLQSGETELHLNPQEWPGTRAAALHSD
jgi:uncharacterized protein with NRDE domain